MPKGIAVWVLIIIVEMLHGIARALFLQPIVGDFRARQIGVLTGSILILVIAWFTIRWIRPRDSRAALRVGLVWAVLTLAFELAFGRYVVRASWARIASDYDLLHGGLLPLGLAVMAVAPLAAAAVRRAP